MPPLRAVCSAMKWQQLSVYSLHPVNSPVVILYWRVILSILRFLSPANRACVALEEYRGNNGPTYDVICQMNGKFCRVAEPVVAQSTKCPSGPADRSGRESLRTIQCCCSTVMCIRSAACPPGGREDVCREGHPTSGGASGSGNTYFPGILGGSGIQEHQEDGYGYIYG
ncbi:unnamed protein product [Mytilus coruscus]|uniref:Uncharacterized protein n=1 Tax=Mytilus coruscus TaxID=42192 RepID=A0A6J8CRJ8_MYTCO|nr:unnamed protein product [Mytilus coruscus]